MQDFLPDIEDVSREVQGLVARAAAEYKQRGIDPAQDYVKGAAWITFTLAFDYYDGARRELAAGNILSGTTLVRTNLENVTDLFYILGDKIKTERRAKAYVDSIEAYREAVKRVSGTALESMEERPVRELNKWTEASIYDRLKATGDPLVFVYDLFSYNSHPNPASMLLVTNDAYAKAMINILQQANEYTMLNTLGLVLSHSDIESVAMTEVNDLAKRLGSSLVRETQS